MKHVVLLGDSIFDNGVYVGSDPAVEDQLRTKLGPDWQVTLLAVDGDVIDDVAGQLDGLPSSATHLALSIGGNDGLQQASLFDAPVAMIGEALLALATIRDDFHVRYARMLQLVLQRGLPTAVCTIYDPNFEPGVEQQMAETALAVLNDQITRLAFENRLPLIDLRTLFRDRAHYANPIEPSARGGELIAEAIDDIVNRYDFSARMPRVWAGRTD